MKRISKVDCTMSQVDIFNELHEKQKKLAVTNAYILYVYCIFFLMGRCNSLSSIMVFSPFHGKRLPPSGKAVTCTFIPNTKFSWIQ